MTASTAVDDKLYRHEMVLIFYLSWNDTKAWGTVLNNTNSMHNGNCAYHGFDCTSQPVRLCLDN